MLKVMFPVCASFGPLFMVMGLLFPRQAPHGILSAVPLMFAVPGALMTSLALLTIHKSLSALERTPSAPPVIDQQLAVDRDPTVSMNSRN